MCGIRRKVASMTQCECGYGCEEGCGERPTHGKFMPGHDQILRIRLEDRVGGLLALRHLVKVAESYAMGKSTAEEFTMSVRQLFVNKPQ
jgi:hypothetical protein